MYALLALMLLLGLSGLPESTAAAEKLYAEGTTGTCRWVVDSGAVLSDGSSGTKMTVSPIDSVGRMDDGSFSDSGNRAPYADFIPVIEEIEIEPGVQNIGAEFFHYDGITALRRIILADSVSEIGENAFCSGGYKKELSVNWGGGIERVGDNAFFHTGLNSLELPNVKSIGSCAFYLCNELKSADLGSGLEAIGGSAFGSCGNLKDLYLPETINSLGPYAFSSCDQLKDVYFRGTWEQWSALTSGTEGNENLLSAKIHYGYNAEYIINIIDGTADKTRAKAGETVTVTASAGDGRDFSGWKDISGGVSFADRRSVTTTFVMPARDVNIQAVFSSAAYSVRICGGRADKTRAKAGETVTLTAIPYGGDYSFSGWESVSGGASFADPAKSETSFIMPDRDVSVSANYTRHDFRKNPFIDVYGGDYCYGPVLWAYYASPQVTKGIDSVRFGPAQTVTRGQCVTFLWRAMGCPEPASLANPFIDIAPDEYWYRPILWAVEKGITKGTDSGRFSPYQTCSAAHIITFLYRTLGIGPDGWYEESAKWAEDEGLLEGTGLTAKPGVNCPRGAVVTFLYRELGSGGDTGELGKNDLLIYVEDYYNSAGRGRVIIGTLVSGSVSTGDEISLRSFDAETLAPTEESYTVLGLEKSRKAVDRAEKGDRVDMLISTDTNIKTPWGSAIVDPESGLQNVTGRFIGNVELSNVPGLSLTKGDTLTFKYPGGEVTAMLVHFSGSEIRSGEGQEGVTVTTEHPVTWYAGQKLEILTEGHSRGSFTITGLK